MELKVVTFLALLAACGLAEKQTRWSRQISSYTSDMGDWVPLPGPVEREPPPIKRQAVAEARILSEPFPGFARPTGFSQESFPARTFYSAPSNRQLYLQSVPSAPQNYLSDQGFSQGLRFGLAQPNFPLNQGFISPQFNFEGVHQTKQRLQGIPNPIKFESPQQSLPSPLGPPVFKSINQIPKFKPEPSKFIDGYRVENNTDFNLTKKKPVPPQKVKFDNIEKPKETFNAPKTKVEREEVQLLYVPLDTLNRGQFNFRSPLTSAQLLNTELYNPNSRPNPLMHNYGTDFQGSALKHLNSLNSHESFNGGIHANFNSHINEDEPVSKFSTLTTPFTTAPPTTPKPKKLKPHQPPLAIFLSEDVNKEKQVKVGDVLNSLKNVKTVPVLDSVNPLNAPDVFIGPSSLLPPETYAKFELPYLSNIDNVDKKLKQLPFFVAPLSYNTPQGFAKIPFPSPHVGSVVINSLIRDTPSPNRETTSTITSTNFYTQSTIANSEPINKQELSTITQKPEISYYTTSSPKTNAPNYEQNYYSIEPQSVSTLRPFKDGEPNNGLQSTPMKSGSYFLTNVGNKMNSGQFVNFRQDTSFKDFEPALQIYKSDTSTQRTTVTTTTKPSNTPPSQLLDTHNPYSINQAFHFSTPLDYHNFFDEYREPYVTPGTKQSTSQTPATIAITPTPELTTKPELVPSQPEQPKQSEQPQQPQQSEYPQQPLQPHQPQQPQQQQQPQQPQQPSYRPSQKLYPHNLQNYIPEIRYESDIKNLNYPVYNTNDYPSKIESVPQNQYSNSYNQPDTKDENPIDTNAPQENIKYSQPQQTNYEIYKNSENVLPESFSNDLQTSKPSTDYNNYDIGYNSQESQSTSTSSTTTTTRRTVRTRGRPRYPSLKSESSEVSTRASITRRPLRERKPIPPRSRYEPNKISTEGTRDSYDSIESTTKSSRTRTRGRVHYKPSDSDDHYTRRNKGSSKENDLAYQRDVLHQNYPVTLMERTSTADIEAITEPSDRFISTNNQETSKTFDTQDAYSNDKLSITEPVNGFVKDLSQQHTTAIDSVTNAPYNRDLSSRDDNFNNYQQIINSPQEPESSYDEVKEDKYSSNEQKILNDNSPSLVTEPNVSAFAINDEFASKEKETATVSQEVEENTHTENHETSQEQAQENIVETTPSYNRVRIRPGVIRQYHQISSTESSKTKSERRRPLHPITYRPALDKRRTTMRIEEIEADLKTKQIHRRPEYQDYKQPVYKPEPSTESVSPSTTEPTTTKKNQIRRRRPNYGSSSTESTATKRTYDIKNRFRGRRPTEKPTEKTDSQSEVSTTTVKNNAFSRYSHRPRLSERYNKKTETDEVVVEDQDSNYSINIPKYTAPDSDRWSPKISKDSFKPFNPNNIADEAKDETVNEKSHDEELDIITARNEYEDILISVTPATNNRVEKKIPDIPPTLEALVEQSKVTKSDSTDSMSTFESMLEEVMKNLEEQDENEYTGHVMKHKGGEIGEIPPERIISSGENYSLKSTTPLQDFTEITTITPENISTPNITEEVPTRKTHRRGFWKRVKKVRPANEEIDVAESQYYANVVNRLGQTISRNLLEKNGKSNSKVVVTTYKPNYQFLKDFFDIENDQIDAVPKIDIPKITASNIESNTEVLRQQMDFTTKTDLKESSTESVNPGDMDLGTGSPDPTFDDSNYYSEPTEPTSPGVDRSDGFSFMDYLFGVTASDSTESIKNETYSKKDVEITTPIAKEVETDVSKIKATTESAYIPDEITESDSSIIDSTDSDVEIQRITLDNSVPDSTERSVEVESSSVSSFMDAANIVSTSMSTEISHETEICFRGKCIKTNKNVL